MCSWVKRENIVKKSTLKELLTQMELQVDALCLFAQPKERQQQILKQKNNQNCQKIKLYGSLTTKELKKKHSSRLIGGMERGSQGGEDEQQGGIWKIRQVSQHLVDQVVPHLHADKLGGTTGERDRLRNPGFQHGGKESFKTSGCKNLWGLRQWEKLPPSQDSLLERPTGSQNVHKPTHRGISTRRPQFACGQQGK